MSKASNSILALSRAFYGKRLTQKQYTDLLGCKSLNEFASYLKGRTVYGESFDAAGGSFTAEMILEALKKHTYKNFAKLCRYEQAIGSEFHQFFRAKSEVMQILDCTMHMLSGNTEGYLMDMDAFLDFHVDIDLYALGRANSLEEMAQALKKTPYEKIFLNCMAVTDRSYLTFETAFDDYLKRYQYELAKKCFRAKEKEEIIEALSRCFDLKYIDNLLRIADYYGGLFAVSNSVLPYSHTLSLFSKQQIEKLTAAANVQEIGEVLLKSPYKDCVRQSGEETQKALYLKYYNYCKKQIRFSPSPAVTMLCYVFLAENEAKNLMHITQGIKYGIDAQEIAQMLTGVGD